MRSAGAVRVGVSRRGIVMWGVLWCVGVSRAWACGPSGVLLGCERGRVSVSLVFFFEEATMPERGGASRAHPGPTRMLLNERTIRHHRVMNVDVPVQERCGSREGQ